MRQDLIALGQNFAKEQLAFAEKIRFFMELDGPEGADNLVSVLFGMCVEQEKVGLNSGHIFSYYLDSYSHPLAKTVKDRLLQEMALYRARAAAYTEMTR